VHLASAGHEVRTAEDAAASACARSSHDPPDLSSSTSPPLPRRVRDDRSARNDRRPEYPVIVLTGRGDDETYARARELGAAQLLTSRSSATLLIRAIDGSSARARSEPAEKLGAHAFASSRRRGAGSSLRSFSQFLPELDVLGALVAGQVGLAVLAYVVFGKRSVPLHDKELGNFARVRVGTPMTRIPARRGASPHRLDRVRIHVEPGHDEACPSCDRRSSRSLSRPSTPTSPVARIRRAEHLSLGRAFHVAFHPLGPRHVIRSRHGRIARHDFEEVPLDPPGRDLQCRRWPPGQ